MVELRSASHDRINERAIHSLLGLLVNSVVNFDKFEVDVPCPKCGFYNPIYLKQARLRDVVICRGCKINIRLDDQMNETRKAVRSLRRAMNELQATIESLNMTLKL